jgi:hypothetical protein
MSKKIKTVRKEKLPFSLKKLDRGSGKLYDELKKLKNEWNDPKTTAKRKKEIVNAYNSCFNQWSKIKEVMRKHGIHIGNLE